jgi:protein-tyrosine phosphatase
MGQKQKRELSNVLVVCHGNICRSPLAGEILARGLDRQRVRDRGLKAKAGAIAAKKVRDFAETVGYSLSTHRAQQVTQADVDWADVVLYMDASNLERLAAYEGATEKAECLGSYVGESRIPDPNYLPRGAELQRVLDLLVVACNVAVEELRQA